MYMYLFVVLVLDLGFLSSLSSRLLHVATCMWYAIHMYDYMHIVYMYMYVYM